MGRVRRRAGKWGGAARLEDKRVAPEEPLPSSCNTKDSTTHATPAVSSTNVNEDIVNLYSIEHPKTTKTITAEEIPFIHNIHIIRPKGEVAAIKALFDGGAMVNAMCTSAFNKARPLLGDTTRSKRLLRMADGAVIPSQRKWEGPIELGSARIDAEFEVFDSKRSWDFLFGKPLLRSFKAIHDYKADTVTIEHPLTGLKTILYNEARSSKTNVECEKGIRLTLDVEQWENVTGGTSGEKPPSRQVPNIINKVIKHMGDKNNENTDQQRTFEDKTLTMETTLNAGEKDIDEEANMHSDESGGEEKPPSREVTIDLETDRRTQKTNEIFVQRPDISVQVHHITTSSTSNGIYTRHTDPFKPERVKQILSEISIGPDTTVEERCEVENLIREFADCFALAMSEVNTVPGATHKLNIPPETKFRTKIPQRSMNPAQKEYLHAKVDEMVEAGIIAPIHPRDVRAVAPVVFSKKTHDGQGLSLDELKHRVNDQCVELGLASAEDLPPRPMDQENTNNEPSMSQKWRLCQDFSEVNRATEIAPMPQGDIREKQQRLSGHRYVHIFDFAAGFYAISIDHDSQPYITFFVEGKGYFKYL